MDANDLKSRQAMPLEVKIYYSKKKIEEFFELTGGKVYLGMSGADSAVLDFIAKQTKYDKEIPRVSVAGAEPPENINFLLDRGVETVPMGISKKDVIIKYGYPVISKEQAMALNRYLRTKDPKQKENRLLGYMGRNGKRLSMGKIANKYRDMIYAPFAVSEYCCDKFKKGPINKYIRRTGNAPILGELAEESRIRKMNYLKHGCIMIGGSKTKCTPLGFWTKQDILRCIKEYDIKIPSIYGDVIEDEDGKLRFSGEQRTGCDVCGFGLLYDLDRLQRLKKRNPKMYNYMMDGGEWVEGDITRPMMKTYGAPIEESNLYWVPNKDGFGYRPVLQYIFDMLGIEYEL